MARLFALVALAAAIVPTAVLGGGGGLASGFKGYTVRQVERAFARQGIVLRRHPSQDAPEYVVDLVAHFPDGATLDVSVLEPSPGEAPASGGFTFVVVSGGSISPRHSGSGFRGNLIVHWQSDHPCRPETHLVRAAFARLSFPPRLSSVIPPSEVRCTKAPQYP